jgi:hypothetical protein|tara:strand:+ start:113 stop:433 length:321 start_codon:yes stop_codon:yes gene_type:complete
MLPILLFNVISSLVIDKATDLAKDHVEQMITDLLPDDAKAELDELIKADPDHPFESATDALQGAVEGKLPILNVDGTFKPIEVNFTVKFDPNTREIEINQDQPINF